MNVNHEPIQLRSERTQKIRTGLYIEEELLDQIRQVADHNNISTNETIVLLVKQGIQALQENEK